jgi:hypothetical protein
VITAERVKQLSQVVTRTVVSVKYSFTGHGRIWRWRDSLPRKKSRQRVQTQTKRRAKQAAATKPSLEVEAVAKRQSGHARTQLNASRRKPQKHGTASTACSGVRGSVFGRANRSFAGTKPRTTPTLVLGARKPRLLGRSTCVASPQQGESRHSYPASPPNHTYHRGRVRFLLPSSPPASPSLPSRRSPMRRRAPAAKP